MQRRLLIALASLLVLAGTGGHAADGPTRLRIGVEGAYPPFSEVGPDGKLKGFDIDIANALCARMKAQCSLVQQDFDGMIPALAARKFDAIIASMSITPERQKQVLFTDKYYQTPARLVAKAGAGFETTPAGLKGKRIGVQRSTIHDRYATDKFIGAEIVRYTKQDEVYLDLAAGRIDAALADSIATEVGLLKTPQGKGFAFFGPLYTEPSYFGIGAGIALRKSDTALAARFNDALRAIRADGTYQKIAERYFNFDVYGDPPATGK
ncbi:ABC transporter substrate-binding protein [Caldimonas sp. KR1-144]|uniref:ABC transporter substrate-binding protein n=1 Tax=Caldimonas sp. KR1-144 TaxID=3400911 RepID=UPI003C10ABB3